MLKTGTTIENIKEIIHDYSGTAGQSKSNLTTDIQRASDLLQKVCIYNKDWYF